MSTLGFLLGGLTTRATATPTTERTATNDERIESVLGELRRAEEKSPEFPTDPLHALAALDEKFGELTKAVLQEVYEPHKQAREDVRKEAVQTATMALRFLLHLEHYNFKPTAEDRR